MCKLEEEKNSYRALNSREQEWVGVSFMDCWTYNLFMYYFISIGLVYSIKETWLIQYHRFMNCNWYFYRLRQLLVFNSENCSHVLWTSLFSYLAWVNTAKLARAQCCPCSVPVHLGPTGPPETAQPALSSIPQSDIWSIVRGWKR